MNRFLRHLFFRLVVRPVVLIVLGLNVRHRERLPKHGPAIVVANHNSHLDTMVLMTLFPPRMLNKLRPVAAQDYFFRNKWLKWFSLRIIGIIPLDRDAKRSKEHPLAPISQSLEQGEIVILFPEGSRGDPEQMGEFKSGIAHLAKLHPDVPVTPIYMHGLGKALPRGEALLVPFFCDVFVGEPLQWPGNKEQFLTSLGESVSALAAEGKFAAWD
jgi:1-acyl-sn-glycerol-3-phosphate acyltransferase